MLTKLNNELVEKPEVLARIVSRVIHNKREDEGAKKLRLCLRSSPVQALFC